MLGQALTHDGGCGGLAVVERKSQKPSRKRWGGRVRLWEEASDCHWLKKRIKSRAESLPPGLASSLQARPSTHCNPVYVASHEDGMLSKTQSSDFISLKTSALCHLPAVSLSICLHSLSGRCKPGCPLWRRLWRALTTFQHQLDLLFRLCVIYLTSERVLQTPSLLLW